MSEQQENVDNETTPLRGSSYRGSTPVRVNSYRGSIRQRNASQRGTSNKTRRKTRISFVPDDSYGYHGYEPKEKKNVNVQSLTYTPDESDVWRAHWALQHIMLRGRFWNHGKFKTIQTYTWIVLTGVFQAAIAYVANFSSRVFIEVSKKGFWMNIYDGNVI